MVAALLALGEAERAFRAPGGPPVARRRPRWQARRRTALVVASCAALLAGVLVGGAFAYDASTSGTIAPGIRIGPVAVGGLETAAARRKVARAYRRLERPVVVRFSDRRFVLRPREASVQVDVDGAVREAFQRSRDGWFLGRAVRSLTGRGVSTRIDPRVRYSAAAVAGFAYHVEAALEHPARPAHVVPHPDRLSIAPGRDGIDVDVERLQRAIAHALADVTARRFVPAPVHRTRPTVTRSALVRRYPSYITVDRETFQLRVFEHLRLARTYPIAVGQVGLETPAGLYHIEDKQVNPSWHVPNSAWAGSLAGQVIPPGPDDPIKARWMGIFDGAGIHGTEETWSLGQAASHGCIRMAIPDVIDLYDRVEVGTPIYVG